MVRHLHRVHGLLVDSPVPLAAGRSPATAQTPDVVLSLRRGRVPAARGAVLAHVADPTTGHRCTLASDRTGGRLLLHGTLCAHVRHDGHVVVTTAAELGDDLLALLLSGPVLAAVAVLRGHPLLHASAVAAPQGAVGFVGPSGAGKSTLARLLTGPGRPLLSDDALRLDVDGQAVLAHRGTTSSRLRPHATDLDLADLAAEASVAASADGRWVVTDQSTAPELVGLAGLVVPLLAREYAEVRARPVPSRSAVMLLSSSPALAGLVDPGLRRAHFALAGAVANAVPVVLLEVPWRGVRSPRLVHDVLAALGPVLDSVPPVSQAVAEPAHG